MKRFTTSLLALVLALTALVPGTALAADSPVIEKGLLITPLRQYLATNAGTIVTTKLSVANLTAQPLNVNLTVKQFSVTDYVYDYKFQPPENDWLQLSQTDVTLQPNQTEDIPFTVNVPTGSAPGGHYYTLFASANLASQGIANTIQAADLIYLTVNGALTNVSHLEGSSINWLSFGRNINFSLKPINTGNIYSFVYVSGQLHGLLVRPPETSTAHILIPGKVRALSGSIPSPILPGLYKASYGYKTQSDWIIQETHWVLYVPPWFIAVLVGALLLAGRFLPRKKSPAHSEAADEKE